MKTYERIHPMKTISENTLGFYNDQGIFTIPAKQYDTGRVFKFNIIDSCESMDLTDCNAYIRILKADGTQFQGNDCTQIADSSTILVDTSVGSGNQILSAPGINRCELHITDQNYTAVTTWNFNIQVEPRVHDGNHIISSDNWDELDRFSETAEKTIANAEECMDRSQAQTAQCEAATELCNTATQSANDASNHAHTAAAAAENVNITCTKDENSFILRITDRNGTSVESQNLIGDTPAFQIGSVTTGEEGSQAAVSLTGTMKQPVLNFIIPRGDTGSIENVTINDVPLSDQNSFEQLGLHTMTIEETLNILRQEVL